MGKSEYSIEEIKKLWQQEPDEVVLKAATKDKEEYPPEIQVVIEEEAQRRRQAQQEQEIVPQRSLFYKFLHSIGIDYEPEWSLLKKTLFVFISLIIAAIAYFFAAAVGRYFGLLFLIPLIGICFCWWIANKFLTPAKKPMVPAIALQAGFVLSFSLIAVLAGEFKGAAMWELLFTAGAVAWLIIRPSIGPVMLLTALHLLTLLAIALVVFLQLELESISPTYKGLLLNLIFRVPAIIFMYTGLRGIRRQEQNTGDVITPATGPSEKEGEWRC